MRDGDGSCGFKSMLSLGAFSIRIILHVRSNPALTTLMRQCGPCSEFGPTPTISTSAISPISDRGPSANTACM